MKCKQCSREISPDEIGLTKKLINRGTEEFFCYQCLAEYFHETADALREMTEHFRAAGCALFPKEKPETEKYGKTEK